MSNFGSTLGSTFGKSDAAQLEPSQGSAAKQSIESFNQLHAQSCTKVASSPRGPIEGCLQCLDME